MIPQNRSPKKKQRVLPPRACSVNTLSGNVVSSPGFTRIPITANTTIPPRIIARLPFSLSGGEMLGFKEMRGISANAGMQEDFSEGEGTVPGPAKARQAKGCPWCGGNDIRTEMKSGKRALWGCLNCRRRWWASLDDPAKVVRARPRLGQKIFKRGVWHMFGGFGP